MDLVDIAKGVPSIVRRTGKWPDALTYKKLSQDRGERAAAAYAGHPHAGSMRTSAIGEPIGGRPADLSERRIWRSEFARGEGPGYAASGRNYAEMGRSVTNRGRYATDTRNITTRLADRKRGREFADWSSQFRSPTSLAEYKRAQEAAAAARGAQQPSRGGIGNFVRSLRRNDRKAG